MSKSKVEQLRMAKMVVSVIKNQQKKYYTRNDIANIFGDSKMCKDYFRGAL